MIRSALQIVLAAALGCGGEDLVEVPATAASDSETAEAAAPSNSDVELYGTLDGTEYGPNAERLIAVGRKA